MQNYFFIFHQITSAWNTVVDQCWSPQSCRKRGWKQTLSTLKGLKTIAGLCCTHLVIKAWSSQCVFQWGLHYVDENSPEVPTQTAETPSLHMVIEISHSSAEVSAERAFNRHWQALPLADRTVCSSFCSAYQISFTLLPMLTSSKCTWGHGLFYQSVEAKNFFSALYTWWV